MLSVAPLTPMSAIFTVIELTNWPPNSRDCAVDSGTKATSSWSWPKVLAPLLLITPTTSNGMLDTITYWPTGCCPAGNRLSTTVCPNTITAACVRSSASPKKAPRLTVQSLTRL
ncbi:hypothetical protein D3C85_1550980 [compost metagenome]